MDGPDAIATLREWAGIVRRVLSEPSIGSITTRHSDCSSPKATSPRSSEMAVKERPDSDVEPLELREDRVLTTAVENEGVISPLADALVLRAAFDGGLRVEQLAMGLDGPAHSTEPVELQHAPDVSGGHRRGRVA